jgi:hypothetical protein
VVASLLRLGTKYGVAYFRQMTVARLLQAIPTTLDQYAQLVDESDTPLFAGLDREQTMLVVLHLARECNLPALLPCCLWYWTPMCGQLNRQYRPGADNTSFTTEDGRVYALDLETYSLCLAAGWRLDDSRRRLIESTLMNCGCKGHICLGNASPRLLEYLLRDPNTLTAQGQSFIYLLENIGSAWWTAEFGLCDVCANRADELWDTGRKESWDTLPSYYELAPWKELLAASELTSES